MEKGKDLHLEDFCKHVQAGSAQISSIADMQRAVWRGAFKVSNPAGLLRFVYRDLCISAKLQNHYSPQPLMLADEAQGKAKHGTLDRIQG